MGILKGEHRNVNKGAEGDTTRKTKTFSKPVRSGPIFLERNFFLAFSSNQSRSVFQCRRRTRL